MAEKNTLLEKVLSLQDKFASLQNQLSDPAVMSDMKKYVQLNKDYKELEPIIKAGLDYKKMVDELASAKDIMANERMRTSRRWPGRRLPRSSRNFLRWSRI